MKMASPAVISIALLLIYGQPVTVGQKIVTHIPGNGKVERKEVAATEEMIEDARRRAPSLASKLGIGG